MSTEQQYAVFVAQGCVLLSHLRDDRLAVADDRLEALIIRPAEAA